LDTPIGLVFARFAGQNSRMSYYLELVSLASIKERYIKRVSEELNNIPPYESGGLRMFLSVVALRYNLIRFRSTGHPFWSDYDVDEEDGYLDALNAPWYDPECIAQWLAQYAEDDSSILFHSLELNGSDFAYQFDGKGKFRYMELRPVGAWKTAKAPKPDVPVPKKEKTRKKRIKEVKRLTPLIAAQAKVEDS